MIQTRLATLEDANWIRRLAVESVIYGVPEGRDTPNHTIQRLTMDSLGDLERAITRGKEIAVLVAHKGDQAVGYLMLQFNVIEGSTGDRQTYLLDMAVEQEFWGSNARSLLVRHASRLTAERGFRYMTATVSATNRRALVAAQRLGFEVERHALVMACGKEGRIPMPGRPESERAHAQSRKRRP